MGVVGKRECAELKAKGIDCTASIVRKSAADKNDPEWQISWLECGHCGFQMLLTPVEQETKH